VFVSASVGVVGESLLCRKAEPRRQSALGTRNDRSHLESGTTRKERKRDRREKSFCSLLWREKVTSGTYP